MALGTRTRRRSKASGLLERLTSRPGLLSFVAYLLLTIPADYPIWPGDPHLLPTEVGGDIVQTAWFLEWTPYAILHGLNPFYTNVINYPSGVDIAQNTGMQLLAIVTAPLTLLVSPLASENLLRFLAFPLSAYAAYWVLRHWTRFAPAAFVGGLLYGFSPYMVTQGEYHLNLLFVPFPPLIFYALFELLVAQRESPKKWGLLLGLFCVLQFFISAEVLATTALIAGISIFFLFFLGIRYVPQKVVHAAKGLTWAVAVIAPLCAFPVFEMLRGEAHYVGPAQGFNNVYNADLLGTFVPTKNMLFAPARLSDIGTRLVGNQTQENGSYLGFPLLALVGYLVVRNWRKLWPLFCLLVAFAAFVFSLGPKLIIDGRSYTLPVQLPFAKIDHLPMIENILPVRLSLYVSFFVAVILATGIDWYRDDLLARGRTRRSWRAASPGRLAIAGLTVVSAVALVPRWPYRTFPLAVGVHPSESTIGLRTIPSGDTVLTYPYPTSFFDDAMLWQALDHMNFRLLGSYALVPIRDGQASIFPTILEPRDVEAMLVNSVTEVADPDLPDLVATAHTITATEVVVLPPGSRTKGLHATLLGKAGSVNYAGGQFYLYKNHFTPTTIRITARTKFVEPGARRPSLVGIALNERVAVYGTVGPGTVTAAMVEGLRTFVRVNHVNAVVLGLGITDAAEIATWFRAAFGHPSRAGAGAIIWNDVARSMQTASVPSTNPVVSALR